MAHIIVAAVAALPDLVIALVDELGYNGMAFSSNNTEVLTPRTSELVCEGVVLDSMYSYRYCSPSRAALMTGRSPGHGIWEINPLIDEEVRNQSRHSTKRLSLASVPQVGVNEEMAMLPAMLHLMQK